MMGWPVEALSERSGHNLLHFAAVGPDDTVWDAAGPHTSAQAAEHYAEDPVWLVVDAFRFMTSGAD